MFDRMESRLERVVNGAFAKAFRSEVSPLEVASAVRKAMDNRATILGRGRTVVPNVFSVELSPNDYDRLTEYREDLEDELLAAAQEHAEQQAYQPGGPLRVEFTLDESLETGVFRIRPSTARRPGPSQSERDFGRNDDADQWYDEERNRPAAAREPERRNYRSAAASSRTSAPYTDDEPARPAQRPAARSAAAGTAGTAGAAAAAAPHRERAPLPYADDYRDDYTAPPDNDDVDVVTAENRTEQRHEPAPRAYTVTERPWLDLDGERYPLIGAITVLGRDDVADIVLDDPGISRRHCEIRVTHDGPHLVGSLRDLHSTNGTFVNGERTSSTRLRDGDRITVGRTSVTFRAAKR